MNVMPVKVATWGLEGPSVSMFSCTAITERRYSDRSSVSLSTNDCQLHFLLIYGRGSNARIPEVCPGSEITTLVVFHTVPHSCQPQRTTTLAFQSCVHVELVISPKGQRRVERWTKLKANLAKQS